jgi:eukaryotic-like serine/threonine-protein kinase
MAEPERVEPGGLLGGRYRLKELIGAGGMATVWAAEDERLGRDVAIKVLSDALSAEPAYVTRFGREAQVAAGLSHPNLVKVYDYGSAEGRPFLVMERVEGRPLSAVLSDDPEAVDPERLARELLGALAHIHAAGVIHRDVKPSNVLTAGDGRAQLTDFGIALPADATHLTQTGHVIGTLSYMAPEVKDGGSATERSDLYSLGVVLAEVLRNNPSAEVEALVERLTARSPEERPASAAAALATLPTGPTLAQAAAADGEAPTAPLPAAGGRASVSGPVAVAVALVAALAVWAALNSDSEEPVPAGASPTDQPGAPSSERPATTPETGTTPPPEEAAPEPAVAPPAPALEESGEEGEEAPPHGKAKGHDKHDKQGQEGDEEGGEGEGD